VAVALGAALQAYFELVFQIAELKSAPFPPPLLSLIANIRLAKNMHNYLYFDAEGFLRVWHSNCALLRADFTLDPGPGVF